MHPHPLVALAFASGASAICDDLRAAYDVLAYDFHWAVVPAEQRLEGAVLVTLRSLEDGLAVIELDLKQHMEVRAVEGFAGKTLEWTHAADRVAVVLPAPIANGAEIELMVRYGGRPRAEGSFDGFHWKESQDGRPWIGTSCQSTGAHDWYPCKASYFHPEDKPERTSTELVVPADLYGVSNGRLVEIREGAPAWFEAPEGEWRTFQWVHPYPLETYSVTLNVGPYVVVEQSIDLPEIDEPVPFIYYVLPENVEKAALQFKEVPALVAAYTRAFGPYPFPDSKLALVETSFWGMEHSTAVAYGSSYPAWCAANGEKDRFGRMNEFFDYILVHELAHEWWGNAVSANDWGHFWIHEGFATYAEGVYVEATQGREAADRYFDDQARMPIRSKGSLYRGDHPDAGQAYTGLIYSKGACVLNTLRHYVDDDERWWRSLRDFNLEYRYGNAGTEEFQLVLERTTGKEWGQFFQEWIYGKGVPSLEGMVSVDGRTIRLSIANDQGDFHVPIDLTWREGPVEKHARQWLVPGPNDQVIDCARPPTAVQVVNLQRVLGKHRVEVR